MTIPLEIIADNYDEADTESFTITLSGATGATIGDPFTGSIADDDDPPKATISGTHMAPEDSGANDMREATDALAVTLSAASTKIVKVDYAFGHATNDTAEKGVDYTASDDQFVFNPSNTTGLTATSMLIPFTVTDDTLNEASETFTITLSIPDEDGNASVEDATKVSIVTITDNDTTLPIISFANAEEKGAEGDGANNGSITFTVSLKNSEGTEVTAGRDIDVNVTTSTPADLRAGATPSTDLSPDAIADYTALTNHKVTIAKGNSSATFDVETIADANKESDEQFIVTLTSPVNATLSETATEIKSTGKILSDEISVFEIHDVSQDEGDVDNMMEFIVTLSSRNRTGNATVEYATSDGTAGQPADYTRKTGTLTFGTDETAQMIQVPIKGDEVHEGGVDETFFVTLSTALPTSEVEILSGGERATGTIREDDTIQISEISVAATNAKVSEGDPVQFTFTSDPALIADVPMMITLTETGGNFLAPTVNRTMITLDTTGPTHIESFATIPVDTTIDPDSVVTLTIETDETRYTIGGSGTASVIVEDDATPTGISIVALEESASEGGTADFQVKSDVVDTNARIINLSITQNNVDFLTAQTITDNQQVTIPADARVATVSLDIDDDTNFERNGTIEVAIADAGGTSATYTKASSDTSASILVLDNDFPSADPADSIAIFALATTVAEAETAPFQIVAKSVNETDARTIRVMVDNKDSGDFLPDTYSNPVDVVIDADALFANLNVTLDDDSKYEEDGAIIATVIAEELTGGGSATYSVSTVQASAEIAGN